MLKNIFSKLLMTSIISSSLIVPNYTISADTTTLQVGDINLDGQIDVIDIILLKKCVLGVSNIELPTFEIQSNSKNVLDTEFETIKKFSLPEYIDSEYDAEHDYKYTGKMQIADVDEDNHLEVYCLYSPTDDEIYGYGISQIWAVYQLDGDTITYDTKIESDYKSSFGIVYNSYTNGYDFMGCYLWQNSTYLTDYSLYPEAVDIAYSYDYAFGQEQDYGGQYFIYDNEVSFKVFSNYVDNIYYSLENYYDIYYFHDKTIEIL